MSRIRTIKPDFFRHELIQSLGAMAMVFFAGLWTVADKNGVFEWKPRHLKLDICPFMDYDPQETLEALQQAGFVTWFEADGRPYGIVNEFKKHQHLNKKEEASPGRYPVPDWFDSGTVPAPSQHHPSTIPTPCKDAKEKEEEKEEEKEKENITPLPPKGARGVFKKPSLEEVSEYMAERNWSSPAIEAGKFVDFYASKGWVVGKSPMKDWKAAVRTWEKPEKLKEPETPKYRHAGLSPREIVKRLDAEGRAS